MSNIIKYHGTAHFLTLLLEHEHEYYFCWCHTDRPYLTFNSNTREEFSYINPLDRLFPDNKNIKDGELQIHIITVNNCLYHLIKLNDKHEYETIIKVLETVL